MDEQINPSIILDELKQNIFIKDRDFRYIFVNKTYADLIEHTPSQIIGKQDYDFFPQEIAQKYIDDDAEVMKTQIEINVQEDIVVDNEARVVKTVKKPLFKEGEVYGVLGIFWDVTEYSLEHNKYIKLQAGLQKAQELAHIGHWELDLISGNLFWSDEVYRIFGREPQSFGASYEAFLEYIHPEDRELVNKRYSDSLLDKQGYSITHRIIKANGELAYVHERCEHEFDKNHNPVRSIGTVHDITEQKMAQSKLLLSAEVFSRMHDGVVITDVNKTILEVNEAFTYITGYTRDEVVGLNPSVLSSGWHSGTFYKQMWEEIITTGMYSGEIKYRKKSGDFYIAETTIKAVHNDEGILTNYISIFSDITEKKEKENLIHNLAYYDHLTQLPNRLLFQERFLEKVKFAKRHKTKIALLFVDMDNFKNINDTLGHTVGDKFLLEIVTLLKSTLRAQDTIARQDGDEFTILIDNFKNTQDILPVINKIVTKFQAPVIVDDIKLYTGTSMGISIYPDDAESFTELVKSADTAMYHVKEHGKNGFHFFTKSINDEVTQRISLEHNLRNAIENDEFFLVYQPKVDTIDKKVYGMEALLRWQNKGSLISPEYFIPIAEGMGLIYEVGLWVFREALTDLKVLHKDKYNLILSINVSSKQFDNGNFVKDLQEIVEEIEIEPQYIELEITETHIMNNLEKTLEKLNHLHSLGFKMAVDDFGTGYSSLSYLKKLPTQTIKIDKSFVLDIDKDDEDKSIVSAIIAIANSLGKDVIAEGSETKEHIDVLSELGCSKIQGYYFSKPLTIDIFKEYVDNFSDTFLS